MTLQDSPNVIGSRAAGYGASQPVSPDGPMTGRCGPQAAPANRSAGPAKAPDLMTRGTCGPTFFESLEPLAMPATDPAFCVGSRLAARLAMVGSTESSLIWRRKVTPAGREIFRLAVSTLRISETDSTGGHWRTPNVEESGITLDRLVTKEGTSWTPGQRAYDRTTGRLCQIGLPQEMEAASHWPTPAVADVTGGRKTRSGDRSDEMLLNGLLSAWSTPRASDGEKGSPNQSFGAGGQPLPAQMHQAIGQMLNGLSATTEKRGAPNPLFAFWLMGFPREWACGALRATQSCRSSQPKFLKRSAKP